MKIALIANPRAGGKKGGKLIPRVEKRLREETIDVDLRVTEYHGHALRISRRLRLEKYDAVVSLGGDGTNYEVLNGLLKHHENDSIPPLGIIPVGRGNSFARDLGIYTAGDGISALVGRDTTEVDVCSFTHGGELYYFINLTGFGFVTDAARTAFRFNFLGDFSYVIGVLYRTIGLAFHKMELEIDGRIISGDNCFVEFCNSRFTGGAMMIAPGARLDDGFFDVVVAGPMSRSSLISTFPKIFRGSHGENPAVSFFKARKVKVRTTPSKALLPDGELFGSTPTEINIHPGLATYFRHAPTSGSRDPDKSRGR